MHKIHFAIAKHLQIDYTKERINANGLQERDNDGSRYYFGCGIR